MWGCILGHNVNLIPTVDCGQKVCKTVFHNPGKSATEIYLGNPLKQKAGKKEKTKTKPLRIKKGGVVFGLGDGVFLRRWVERAA